MQRHFAHSQSVIRRSSKNPSTILFDTLEDPVNPTFCLNYYITTITTTYVLTAIVSSEYTVMSAGSTSGPPPSSVLEHKHWGFVEKVFFTGWMDVLPVT